MEKSESKRTLRLGQLETVYLISFIVFLCINPTTQQTNNEPVNIGLICAIPWDISNTLRAPIGGPVSLALSAIMALILVFGFLLAPVNYILGYPSRIYHPARKPGLLQEFLYSDDKKTALGWPARSELTELVSTIANRTEEEMFGEDSESRSFSINYQSPKLLTLEDERVRQEDAKFPDFLSSAFLLIPEEDTECRKLILCHAHGFLTMFPTKFTKIVRFFSKRLMSIPQEYQTAVMLGLNKQGQCQQQFKCSKNISVLLKNVLYNMLSTELKKIWKLQKLF